MRIAISLHFLITILWCYSVTHVRAVDAPKGVPVEPASQNKTGVHITSEIPHVSVTHHSPSHASPSQHSAVALGDGWMKDSVMGNLTNFKYLHIPSPCMPNEPPIYLFVLVDSAPSHVGHRERIRNTYGAESLLPNGLRTRTIFMAGQVKDRKMQEKLDEEAQAFGDIIQGNFVDHYRNQSYGNLAALRWLYNTCPETKFIMKTDDDTFFDIFQLVDLLHLQLSPGERMLCVQISKHAPVIRDPAHRKWYMTKQEFPRDFYDPYCTWSSYFFKTSVARKLDQAARSMWEGISINDIYISGTLPRKLSIPVVEMPLFKADESYWESWASKASPGDSPPYVIAPFHAPSAVARTLSLLFRRAAIMRAPPSATRTTQTQQIMGH